MSWRAISARSTARRVIDTRFQSSFIDLNGIIRRGERCVAGPLVEEEARRRSSSCYLPDQVVSMFPMDMAGRERSS